MSAAGKDAVSGPASVLIDYELPEELIAQEPAEPRDSSRLLLLDRFLGSIEDRWFFELPDLVRPGDLLVVNDTRVLSARLFARRRTGGRVEVLLLERKERGRWEALLRPLGRLHPGERLEVEASDGSATGAAITFVSRSGDTAIVDLADEDIVEAHGRVPLPPYIRTSLVDPERYQTVYASRSGSVAAPTAGLHFTPELLGACRARGVEIDAVTLHVGVDTFRPIVAGDVAEHRMHSERFRVSRETLERILATRALGGRVIAVGTTVARVLETVGQDVDCFEERWNRTSLFIKPPYEFKLVDGLITNFHLPRTTLLLLVGAFAGEELLTKAYRHAVDERYRFYSFGDAMLIV